MTGIYKITNLINGKVYIGQSKNINKRWKGEKGGDVNSHLKTSFKKYGIENFCFEVLEECDVNELDQKEIFYIEKYNSIDRRFGYNKCSGGSLNKKMSQESIDKMSKANYGKKHSEETKRKIKIGVKKAYEKEETRINLKEGRKNRIYTEDFKEKLANASRERSKTKEYRDKISNSLKGHSVSEEARLKISKAKKGKKLPKETCLKMSKSRTGRSLTQEWKNNISKGRKDKKKVIQLSLNGEFINEFNSVSDAIKSFYPKQPNIGECCNGKYKTSAGFIWKFA